MINGIGFTGKMMSGKDTCAEFLKNSILKYKGNNFIVNKLAFADSLKEICMNYLGLTKHQCYDQEGKQEFNSFWGMTNREILQRVGTEAMRTGFHPDVWAKITDLKLKKMVDDGEFFIVTDIRFPNEAQVIHDNGGLVVEIIRPGTIGNGISNHASEQKLPSKLIDKSILNDGSLQQLQLSIDIFRREISKANMLS